MYNIKSPAGKTHSEADPKRDTQTGKQTCINTLRLCGRGSFHTAEWLFWDWAATKRSALGLAVTVKHQGRPWGLRNFVVLSALLRAPLEKRNKMAVTPIVWVVCIHACLFRLVICSEVKEHVPGTGVFFCFFVC